MEPLGETFRIRQLGGEDGPFGDSGWSKCSYSQMAVPGPHLHRHANRTSRSQLQIGKLRLSTALPGATVSGACLTGSSSHLGTVELTFASGEGSMQLEAREVLGASVLITDWPPVWNTAPQTPRSQKQLLRPSPRERRSCLV